MSDDLLRQAATTADYFDDGGDSQTARLLVALLARCERAEADAVHWKANHDKQVDSKRHTHDLLVQSRQHVESLLRSHEAADEEIDRLRQRLKKALR